jgi:hypothetical protein
MREVVSLRLSSLFRQAMQGASKHYGCVDAFIRIGGRASLLGLFAAVLVMMWLDVLW